MDYLGITNVLTLRRCRHDQMVAHQPHNQLGIVVTQTVATTERFGIERAQHGMITTTPLGDVMIQTRDQQQLLFGNGFDQITTEWKLMGKCGHGKTAQIAYHHQAVLIDSIDVK